MPKFRTQFDDYSKRLRPKLECLDPSLTDQSQKDATDINKILEKFGVTGRIAAPVRIPQYADYRGVGDFTSARAAILLAEDAFMALPPEFRHKLHNSPQEFLEYVQDDKNRKSLEDLGYVIPAKQEQSPPATEPPPAAPPAAAAA